MGERTSTPLLPKPDHWLACLPLPMTSNLPYPCCMQTSDEELKWLSWPEFLQLCGELRRECAGLDSAGRRRSDKAVAWSLQARAGGRQHWHFSSNNQHMPVQRHLTPVCAGFVTRPFSALPPPLSLQRYLIFAIFSCVPDRQVGGLGG